MIIDAEFALPNTQPIVRWAGGKRWLLDSLLPLIPPHTCYVEAFCGGASMLLGKGLSKVEVINDADGQLVSLYRCAQNHLESLLDELRWLPNSREEFRASLISAYGESRMHLTDIQRSARWFHAMANAFGGGRGKGSTFGYSPLQGGSGASRSRSAWLASLESWNARMDRVTIECGDWVDLIERYDRPTTFWFLDPPYTDCVTTNYAAAKAQDVPAMASRIRALKGTWILTFNDCPEIRAEFPVDRYQVTRHERKLSLNNANGGRPGKPYAEVIIRPKGQPTAKPRKTTVRASSAVRPEPVSGSQQTSRMPMDAV